jgi:hypothetical protein
MFSSGEIILNQQSGIFLYARSPNANTTSGFIFTIASVVFFASSPQPKSPATAKLNSFNFEPTSLLSYAYTKPSRRHDENENRMMRNKTTLQEIEKSFGKGLSVVRILIID